MKAMSDANGKIQLAPLRNISNMRATKRGSVITINVPGNVLTGLLNGDFVGGLILCDKAEFLRVSAEMEAASAATTEGL